MPSKESDEAKVGDKGYSRYTSAFWIDNSLEDLV